MSTHLIPVSSTTKANTRSTTSTRDRDDKAGENANRARCEKNMPYTYYFEDMFLFKKKEQEEKEREKIVNRSRKVHEKTTFSSRMKNRSHLGQIDISAESASCELGLDSAIILSFVERGADEKKSKQEFIRDQRERFMLEYTLATKRKTMMKLQRCMEIKEQQFLNAEKRLQEDAFAFEEFLRENDQKSVDALKIEAQETIGKLQMASELKKANLEIQVVKSEIMKTEFLLKEYIKYGCFLLKLSPKTWQVQQALKKIKSKDTSSVPSLPKLVPKPLALKKSKLDKESPRRVSGLISVEDEPILKRMVNEPLEKELSSQKMNIENRSCQANLISYFDSVTRLMDKENTMELVSGTLLRSSKENFDVIKKVTSVEDSGQAKQESGGSEGPSTSRKMRNSEEGKKSQRSLFDKKKLTSPKAASVSSEDSLDISFDEIDCDLEPELYFKEPEELLHVLTELEEQNLTLVQYSQDVDETLEDVSKREKAIQDKVNSSIESLLDQKEMLKNSCAREEEKAAELELRSRLFNFGEFNSDTQEKLIDSLSRKVNQVYKVCIGEVDVANLNPVQKLVKVESRLVELSDLIDSVPKESVEVIEKAKQRERRQKMREEKMREKQRSQEEKIRIALERAVSKPKKKVGRKLVYRSQPVSDIKQEILFVDDTKSKLLEEQYFFS